MIEMAWGNFATLFSILIGICIVLQSEAQKNELSQGLSSFASKFYGNCAESREGENIITSPLSVSIALALLSQGANGSTYVQLKKGLHLSGNKNTIANKFHKYNAGLEKSAGQASLLIADQIYVQQGKKINKQFRDVAVQKFSSGIEALNFNNAAESAQAINQFVESKTNNKIKDIVKPDSLDERTRLILVNAIYFNGTWQHTFDKRRTRKQDFYINDADKISIDFMHKKREFNYRDLADLDATALAMNYKNSELSFLIILPKKRTGLSALETKLQNYDLSKMVDRMYSAKVDVKIPKFSFDFDIKLNDVLTKMGMGEMFTSQANLSGLLEEPELLFVSQVVHKAFIEVHEAGTEAAAATGVEVIKASASHGRNMKYFHADHPFVFYIWDKKGKTPVFSGRFAKPINNILEKN